MSREDGDVKGGPVTDERRDHLQTLERGLAVIGAFAGRGPQLSLGELADLTGLGKPIVRR